MPETIQALYKHHTSAPPCPEALWEMLRHLAEGLQGVKELMERAGVKKRLTGGGLRRNLTP